MILARKKDNIPDPELLIGEKIRNNDLSSLLVIVPTNRKARSLKREFITASGNRVAGKINIDTIGTFTRKIHSGMYPLPMQMLSEAVSAVLMKRSFKSVHLKYFNTYKSDIPSGTLSRVLNIISEYKRHGISSQDLLKDAEKLEGSEKLKARDIAKIYEVYNQECVNSNSGDTGDIYKSILDCSRSDFKKAFASVYPGVDLVVINGFDEFTYPEIEIIDRINIDNLFISFDYYDENPALFRHLRECYERFTARGFYIADKKPDATGNSFQEIIWKEYFRGETTEVKKGFNINEIIAIDREREIELIAKEIKELLRDGSVEPDKICVVFNLIQDYSPLIRNKFAVFRIPYNLTDRIPLSSAGPVTAVISFLEVLETDFYYKSIFRTLSSGFISVKNVSLSDLITAAAELKIISGYDTWRILLEDNIKTAEPNKAFVYRSALESVNALKELLSSIEGKMNIREFSKRVLNVINSLSIPENILSYPGETETYFKSLTTFYDVLNELFAILQIEYGNEKEFTLNFYLDEIRTAAENSRFNIREKPGYGVQVTNLNEIRGLKFDYLFIGGMIDGDLPTRYTPEIFFSGSYSREEWKHQVEERYHFYQSLCTWEKGLYLTRALQDENRELVPSNFLSELKNHFVINEKTEKDYSGTIYSQEELQDYAGQNLDNPDIINDLPGIDIQEIKKITEISGLRSNQAESEYNGYILAALNEELRARLKKMSEREYSASQLELYAKCPFSYFLEKILYLNVTEEPAEEVEPIELGNMVHRILYLFYTEWNKNGITLKNCSDKDFRLAEEIIFRIADEVINESPHRSPLSFLEIEKLKGLNGERKNSVLYKFLLGERENEDGYKPYDFEVPFGNIPDEEGEGRINDLREFAIDNIRLRGKIDRLDIDTSGSRIRVTDYKLSGRKPDMNDLERGISLQLPLYLYAAKELILKRMKKEFHPAGADIYSLKYQDGKFGRLPVVANKRRPEEEVIEEYERIIEICTSSIKKYVERIGSGIFNLSDLEDRENKACLYCNFKLVCRVNEKR
jgi:ATP-dependent helicase/nuclease subunit B